MARKTMSAMHGRGLRDRRLLDNSRRGTAMGFEFLRANDRDLLVAVLLLRACVRHPSRSCCATRSAKKPCVRTAPIACSHSAWRPQATQPCASNYAGTAIPVATATPSRPTTGSTISRRRLMSCGALRASRIVLAGFLPRARPSPRRGAAQRRTCGACRAADRVVDGRGYLAELAQSHRAYLEEETGQRQPDASDTPAKRWACRSLPRCARPRRRSRLHRRQHR